MSDNNPANRVRLNSGQYNKVKIRSQKERQVEKVAEFGALDAIMWEG